MRSFWNELCFEEKKRQKNGHQGGSIADLCTLISPDEVYLPIRRTLRKEGPCWSKWIRSDLITNGPPFYFQSWEQLLISVCGWEIRILVTE